MDAPRPRSPLPFLLLVLGILVAVATIIVGGILLYVAFVYSRIYAVPDRPTTIYEPDLFGRPSQVQCDDGVGTTCSMVLGGTRVVIDERAVSLEGRPPDRDSFVLYGADPDVTWYASYPIPSSSLSSAAPRACQWVRSIDTWDDGGSIIFGFSEPDAPDQQIGVRVPKSPRWYGPEPLEDGRYPSSEADWCLDRDGTVLSSFGGGPPH